MPASARDCADPRLLAAASSVVRLTEGVFAELVRLARAVADLVALGQPALGAPRDREIVEPAVSALLRAQPLMTGGGLALWPPADRPRPSGPAFAWWVLRDGEVRRKQHVLNPRSDSFYEVTEARWFRVPHRTGQPTLLSPYVDSWGTDEATVTAAVPLTLDGEVIGVAAADLDVRRYLASLEQILATADATAVLDEDGRVIASTHPRMEPGARPAVTGLAVPTARVDIRPFGWAIVRS
jgi:hypothetical protein